MLVVDLHALHTVDVLHLVDDIILHGRGTLDVKDVGRSDVAVGKRSAGTHEVVLLHKNLLRQRHKIFLLLAKLRRHGYLTVTTFDLTEFHLAIDFADHGRVARVAGLEKLGHTGKTTGDVTGVTGSTRNLHEHLTRSQFLTLIDEKVGTYRQRIRAHEISVIVIELGCGHLRTVLRLDDDFLAEVGALVALRAERHALFHILEADLTTLFRNDNGVEGVPFANHVANLHGVAVLEIEFRTVRDVSSGQDDPGFGLDNTHLSHTAYNDANTILVLDRTELVDLKFAVVAGSDVLHGCHVACHTTDVERTESKLRTGLTD